MQKRILKSPSKIKKQLFLGFLLSILSIIQFNCSKDGSPSPPPCEDQELGIYSETASQRLTPDVDSYIGTIQGGGGTWSNFVDDNNEKIDGGISKRMTVSVDGSQGQWAGWLVQWGVNGSPETESKDMSAFEGGTLTFWVKTTVNLEIGIRSSNVSPGTETSKVYLSNYPPFTPNGTWQKVSIPLSNFTGSPPKADLSKIKIFFVVASNTLSGGTGGNPATFWVDDIRWEKVCP